MPPQTTGDGEERAAGGGGGSVSAAEAAIRAATREAEDTLNKHKSVMRFTHHDRSEVRVGQEREGAGRGSGGSSELVAGRLIPSRRALVPTMHQTMHHTHQHTAI